MMGKMGGLGGMGGEKPDLGDFVSLLYSIFVEKKIKTF